MKLDEDQKIAGIIALIFISICIYCGVMNTTTKQNITEEQPKIEVLYSRLCVSDYGNTVICSGVKNKSQYKLDVILETNIYNKDGVQIQDRTAYINNLEPGGTAEDRSFPVPKDSYSTKITGIRTKISK